MAKIVDILLSIDKQQADCQKAAVMAINSYIDKQLNQAKHDVINSDLDRVYPEESKRTLIEQFKSDANDISKAPFQNLRNIQKEFDAILAAKLNKYHIDVRPLSMDIEFKNDATQSDPSSKMEDESNLLTAVENDRLAIVDNLLNRKAAIEETHRQGKTALMVAAERGHLSILKSLIQHKAEINGVDVCGNTPLILAASSYGGHPLVVEHLLEQKANINAKNKESGKTALSFAISNHYRHVIPYLRGSCETRDLRGRTALFVAVERDDPKTVEVLLLSGADLNAVYETTRENVFAFAQRTNNSTTRYLEKWVLAQEWIKAITAAIPVLTSPLSTIIMGYIADIQLLLSDLQLPQRPSPQNRR